MAKSVFDGAFDQLDRAILEELQVNGRISVADLARKIFLSPPAVYQRIKRLERAGMIRQYVALLDYEMADHKALERFISEHLMTLPGIEKIETSVVLNEIKVTTAVALK